MMGEFYHLMAELDRTGDAAAFNGQSLLTREGGSASAAHHTAVAIDLVTRPFGA